MQTHKYMARHAEPEAQALASDVIDKTFEFALVLPCYDEDIQNIERIATFCGRYNALLILVVNQPEAVEHCERNEIVIEQRQSAASKSITATINLCRGSILLIDRTLQRIPTAQGVGLARKIGADCAYALIMRGIVTSPWIFCTDADAELPPDYFTAPAIHTGCSAVIYPFEHVACGDTNIDIATALYELRLHQYVAGLQRAGSPYAFHTLGSTLAINATHYAAAHGFPRRAGGEDFYLLNKLAKLAPVKSLQQPLLQLRSRASHRVPFGTGPAVTKLAGSTDMLMLPLFYHAEGFSVLKCWLDFFAVCARKLSDGGHIEQWRNWLQVHAGTENSELLLQLTDTHEFEKMLFKARRQCRDAQALQRYLHTWFDGFRTLKLLHVLRDKDFPLQSFQECFGVADGEALLTHIVSLNRQWRDGLPG